LSVVFTVASFETIVNAILSEDNWIHEFPNEKIHEVLGVKFSLCKE